MKKFLKRLFWTVVMVAAVGGYLFSIPVMTEKLDHDWKYFQMDTKRTFPRFLKLSALSYAYPTCWSRPKSVWIRLATKDYAFSGGTPYRVEETNGVTRAYYRDEDYLGDVVTEDGWPVKLGDRFKATRLLKTLIPAVEGEKMCKVLDARVLPASRFKRILEEYSTRHGGWRLWCIGEKDYILTPPVLRTADFYIDAFKDDAIFSGFVAAGILSPADLFASYIGTDYDVMPALANVESRGAFMGVVDTLKLPFSKDGELGIRATDFTSDPPPPIKWLVPGSIADEDFALFTNRIETARAARVTALKGFLARESGEADKAVELFAEAAKTPCGDPLLQNLADMLDLEGRRYLAIGNANAAMMCYENRSAIFPSDIATIHNFGICLKKGGHPEDAAKVFLQAVVLDPENDAHRLELVETAAAAGKIALACRELDVLIGRHPDDPSLKLRAARLWCRADNSARDNARAVSLAEAAVSQTEGKDKAFLLGLADVYIETGDAVKGVNLKRSLRTGAGE